jgi:hypothetical protein
MQRAAAPAALRCALNVSPRHQPRQTLANGSGRYFQSTHKLRNAQRPVFSQQVQQIGIGSSGLGHRGNSPSPKKS